MSRITPKVADVQAGGGGTHAVRFCYLMTGAVEQYMESGDKSFLDPLLLLWDEVVSTRMYVTGGIGYNERIPKEPFDLPQWLEHNPDRDIAETCASVSLMMWSWRMHAVTGDSRCFDVIETILYNHYLGAISADHLGNFYYNPIRRVGDMSGRTDHGADPVRRLRLPRIHSTACCLPNSWRFFGQLPEYVVSTCHDGLTVNLYTDAEIRATFDNGATVRMEMKTGYPHEGRVSIRILPPEPVRFALRVRIPEWCEQAEVSVAGGEVQRVPGGRYHHIERVWESGDEVALDMLMEPMVLMSRPEVAANRGQVAFRRGPLVYCLEKQDAKGLDLDRVMVDLDRRNPRQSVTEAFDEELGFHLLEIRAGLHPRVAPDEPLYAPARFTAPIDPRKISLIPFYFRANRADDTRWITFIRYR
jgi:hypothetical protein